MESKLFEYSVCDISDDMRITCWECTLRENIGKFAKGEKFPQIEIQYDEGKILLFKNNASDDMQLVATYELHLVVGNSL